jgi:hypothetical protein
MWMEFQRIVGSHSKDQPVMDEILMRQKQQLLMASIHF